MKKKSGKRAPGASTSSKQSEHHGIRAGGSDGAAVDLTGKVLEFRTNHHDDIDGFTLDDGTVIRFTPHIGHEVEGNIKPGDEVHVVGSHHETPHGDIHIRASFMECLAAEFEIDIDRFDRKKNKRGHSRDADRLRASLPYREILAEITAIRTLLQDRILPNRTERQLRHDHVLKELRELRGLLQPE